MLLDAAAEACWYGPARSSKCFDAHLKDGSVLNTNNLQGSLRVEPRLSLPVLQRAQVALIQSNNSFTFFRLMPVHPLV